MKLARNPRKLFAVIMVLGIGLFAFWFITAPAMMPVQRIAAGSGPVSKFIIRAADSYEAPLYPLCKFPLVRRMADALGDWWWDVLDPPDTTP